MANRFFPFVFLAAVVFISTFLVWTPFIIHRPDLLGLKLQDPTFQVVKANFDGPLYIIVAKTWYDPKLIEIPGKGSIIDTKLKASYFPAHLPLYPFFIQIFSFMGYLKSMLVTTVLATVGAVWILFWILKRFKLTEHPLILSTIFLFLPRFLVVRSVGSPESLFIGLILLSLFTFEKKKYILAGLFGALACIAKTPGILLFVAYLFVFIEEFWKTRKWHWSWLAILLIPAGLLSVFGFFYVRTGDFFAYFHTGGVVPMPYLFSAFNFQAKWVGMAWLEDIVFYFFLYGIAAITLWKSHHRSFFYFTAVFLIATLFVQHRDIARYSLPLWPLACIAFEKFFTSRRFLIVFVLLLPAIYLYTVNFIAANTLPIITWSVYQ